MKNKLKNLPINQKYELINVSRFGIENGIILQCDNCGRSIVNFANIKGLVDGITYTIGLDCLDNILEFNQLFDKGGWFEYDSKKTTLKQCIRLFAEIDKKIDSFIDYYKAKNVSNIRVFYSENNHFKTVGYKVLIDCDYRKDYDLTYACTIPNYEAEMWQNILKNHSKFTNK